MLALDPVFGHTAAACLGAVLLIGAADKLRERAAFRDAVEGYALAGNGASVTYGSFPYSHATALNDVTSGSNGSCGGSYLCTSVAGFDGPTGLGTPNGTGAF